MTVYLYRHAQTAGTLEKRYIGRTDQPLCPIGMELARSFGERSGVTCVYTSDLLRSRETAALWFPRAELRSVSGLDEMDFGIFEGKNYTELADSPEYRSWVDSNCEGACPGGESMERFIHRVREALSSIEAEAPAQPVIIVAHGGTLMALMSLYARPERPYFDWHAGPCGGYRLNTSTGEWAPMKGLP